MNSVGPFVSLTFSSMVHKKYEDILPVDCPSLERHMIYNVKGPVEKMGLAIKTTVFPQLILPGY